jgi:hypothetical protein
MSNLRALANLYDVSTSDAEGYELSEPELHAAVVIGIAAARSEARRTIQRLSPLDECPGYLRGELAEADRVLRFADVDLAGLLGAERKVA